MMLDEILKGREAENEMTQELERLKTEYKN